METLHRYYIIGDKLVESTEPLTHYDYSVKSTTRNGAESFLKMIQDHRKRNPNTSL